MRRLNHKLGEWMDINQEWNISKEAIESALSEKRFSHLRHAFRECEFADVADSIKEFQIDQSIVLFRLIPKARRAEVFAYLPFDLQEKLLEELPDEFVISILNEMEPVDRTRLLESLDLDISNRIILKLAPEERQVAWQLLSYPEESVGRIMSPEFLTLTADMRASDAIEHVRWNASRFPEERILHLFVLDDQKRYMGDVSLATLLIADPTSTPVSEIMDRSYAAISVYADREVAVDSFRKYDRTYIPVVDDQSVLLGVVQAEDVFDVAEEEASEDIQQFGGIEALEESYFETDVLTLLRKRAGWLSILFIGGLLTSAALKTYNSTFTAMNFLVFFLPLIISSGGNSGSQAASLIIRGIAVREMDSKDWARVLSRELITGIGLGVILGLLGICCAWFWGYDVIVAIILAISLVGVVVFGAVVGSMLPFSLKRVGLDPAVCSSPLVATFVDVVGVVIFSNVAIAVTQYVGQP